MKTLNELPEKWTIKRDSENWEIVSNYLNSLGGTYSMNNPVFPWVTNWEGKNKSTSGKLPEYIEITFEDFKRLVLKENNEIQIQLW